MENSVSLNRMFTNRKLLAVLTLATVFFLLETRANAAVIGNIQRNSTFNSSSTDTVFLNLEDTNKKLVPVGASSTLIASSSTDSTDDNVTALPITVAKAVPEPLTILGSGVALGFGVLFKKEYSKKQKKS